MSVTPRGRMQTSFFTVVMAVARVTFAEILRDKVLYNIALFGLILLGLGYAASQVTVISPERVILDLGFTAINISCALIAILNGASMLAKELDRRTIWVALARPISRFQFVFGKYWGLCLVLFVNWAMVSGVEILLYLSYGGALTSTIAVGFALLLVQSWFLAAVAVFFSSFSTTSISVTMCFGIYLLGNSITELGNILAKIEAPVLREGLQTLKLLLPNLEHFNLGFRITYSLPVDPAFVAGALVYAGLVSWVCLAVSGRMLQGKEG